MNNTRAFTLIELLIAISIVSILFGYALPSFDNFLKKSKVKANLHRLTQTIQMSRLEAITKNVRVTLCPTNSGSNCVSNWSSGYMAFVDKKGDREFNEGDMLLYYFNSTDEKSRLTWRSFGARHSLQWLEAGITNHQNGTFEFCLGNDAKFARGLFITKAGRVRYSKDKNGDGIHEKVNGEPIRC